VCRARFGNSGFDLGHALFHDQVWMLGRQPIRQVLDGVGVSSFTKALLTWASNSPDSAKAHLPSRELKFRKRKTTLFARRVATRLDPARLPDRFPSARHQILFSRFRAR